MAIQLGFGLAPDAKDAAEQFVRILNGQAAGVTKLSEAITHFNDDGQVLYQTFKAITQAGEIVTVSLREQQGAWELMTGKVDEATASLKALEAQEKAALAASRQASANAAEAQLSGFLNRPGLNTNQINGMENALQRVKAQIESGAVSLQRFQEIYNTLAANPKAIIPNMTAQEAAVTNSLRSIMAGLTQTGKLADDVAKKWYISWQGVVRLIEAQVVKRIAGFMQSSFAEGVKSASEFSIKIAEIETISQNAELSTSQWTNGIRELSAQFGNSQADVAEAAYQAVSNQIVKGAQTFEFLASTAKFARASVSSLADAGNLAASAMQSFKIPAEEAERVYSIFFKTIELGRVRAKDLADTFGRVGPSAAAAGIKLEEVGAAIATLTTKGVSPNESMTLLNNLILKLVKPTEEMKKLFDEWGVSSGAAAIQTFGFAGVLNRLDQEAQKGGSRLGDLLGQIRAIRATLSLTGGSLGDVASNLSEITKGQGYYDKAADIVGNSFGKRLEIQLNKAKVFFAEDFGDSIIRNSVRISESLGGLDTVLKTLFETIKPIVIAVGSFSAAVAVGKTAVTFWNLSTVGLTTSQAANLLSTQANTAAATANAVATNSASTAAERYAASLGTINLIAAAFSTSFTIGTYIFSNDDVDRAERLKTQLEKIAVLRLQAGTLDPGRQVDRDTTRETVSKYETLYQAVSAYYSKQNILAQDARNRSIENLKSVTETTKAAATSFLGGINQQLSVIKDAASTAKSMIKDSLKQAEDLPRKLGKDLFSEQLKYASSGHINPATGLVVDEQQIELIKKKIIELSDLARREYSKGTKESVEEARKLFADAEKLTTELFEKETSVRRREFDESVKRGGVMPTKQEYDPVTNTLKPVYEFKVKTGELEANLNRMLQERLRLEAQVRANAAQELADAQEQELAEKERLKSITQALTTIEQLNVFNKQGKLKAEFKDDPSKALAEFDRQAEIIREQASRKDLDVQIQSVKFLNDQRKALETEVQAALTEQQLRGEQDRTSIALKASKDRIAKIQEDITSATSAIARETKYVAEGIAKSSLGISDQRNLEVFKKNAEEAIDIFNSNATAENLERVQRAIERYAAQARGLLAYQQGKKSVLDLDPKDEAVQKIKDVETAGERLEEEFLRRNAARDAMKEASEASAQLGEKIGSLPNIYKIFSETVGKSSPGVVDSLETINKKTEAMITNFEKLISKIKSIREDLPPVPEAGVPSAPGDMFGRSPKYMNTGGFIGFIPRGSDTEPAMISRKEMVMNEYATGAFLPLLQAMNSGIMRSGDNSRNQTFNIGDIHVHGGATETQSARNIARSLRREIRRGNVSLT